MFAKGILVDFVDFGRKENILLLDTTPTQVSYLHSFHFWKMSNSIASVWFGANLNSDTSSGVCSGCSHSPSSAVINQLES